MTQYQTQPQVQERVKLQPLKLRRRKGKGLLWLTGAIMTIATVVTIYRQQPQQGIPGPKGMPQPQPSPISGKLPGTAIAEQSSPPPLVSVQPLEEPTATVPDINHLIKVTAKPGGQPKSKTKQKILHQTDRTVQNPTPQAKQAKKIGTLASTATATSIAVPGTLVVGASAVANPVKLTTVGDAGTGAIAGNLTQKAITTLKAPLPNLGNGGGNPPLSPTGGSGGSGGEGSDNPSPGEMEGDTPPCCTTGCQN